MTSSSDQHSATTGETSRIHVQIPGGWAAEESPRPEVEFFAFPQVSGEGVFVPNIVGTINPFAGGLHEFSASAQGHLFAQFEDLRVIDVTWWEREQGPARAILSSRTDHGRILVSVDYLFIEKGWAVQLTATMTPPSYRALRPVFDAIAATARVADHVHDGDGPADVGHQIRLDEVATQAMGLPCERLDSVRSLGVYRSSGPVLSSEAWELLVSLAQGHRPGRMAQGTPAVHELQRAELMDGTSPSEEAGLILELLARPQAQITVHAHRGERATDFQAWFDSRFAVIAAGPSAGYLDHEQVVDVGHSGYRQLDVVTTEDLPGSLFAWAGAGPAWSLALDEETVSQEQLMRHWTAQAEAPGSSPVDQAVWAEPWFIWTLNAAGPTSKMEEVVRVSAGDRGTYRLYASASRDSGEVSLQAEPSWTIYEHLLGTVSELVGPHS